MQANPKFSKGDKVLCLESPLIHEAQCLDVKITENNRVKYLIHYIGWHQRWDEWVAENRLMIYNDQNLLKKNEVYKAYRAKVSPTNAKRPNLVKSKLTPHTDSSAVEQPSPTCTIKLPDELRKRLADDRFYIRELQLLIKLPAIPTISELLGTYVEYKQSSEDPATKDKRCAIEISESIKVFFNMLLETQLLYHFEQPQYVQIRKENPRTPLSDIYGAVHLVRLFVKLDRRLQLEDNVQAFFNYLVKYSSGFFSFKNYSIASPVYLQKYSKCKKKYSGFENVPI